MLQDEYQLQGGGTIAWENIAFGAHWWAFQRHLIGHSWKQNAGLGECLV